MKLTFLGTRGEIKVRSCRHRRHSSLLVQQGKARIMLDCGADWLGQLHRIVPTAIVLTHAHRDHAAGLAKGAPCPVYATEATWDLLSGYPIADRRQVPLRKWLRIGGLRLKAFPVQHSIRAPAVGYRICSNKACFFYLPDVAELPNISEALHGITIYIGDGARTRRPMVRMKEGVPTGHASITQQLVWCAQACVRRVIFTHCGSAIVRGQARQFDALVRQLGAKQGIDARLAYDGDRLTIAAASSDRGAGVRYINSAAVEGRISLQP